MVVFAGGVDGGGVGVGDVRICGAGCGEEVLALVLLLTILSVYLGCAA